MQKPLFKTVRLYSKGSIETFHNVWFMRYVGGYDKGIELAHGKYYGSFTQSMRPLETVYQITTK